MRDSDTKTARQLTCVTYHHFAEAPCPAMRHLGITTSPAALARQLDYFAEAYNVVGLDEVVAGRLPDRALLITIDDSYRSVAEIAAPALAARGLKAVLFANPKPVAEPFVPLDNILSLARARLSPAAILTALRDRGFDGSTLARLAAGSASGLTLTQTGRAKSCLLRALGEDEAALHRRLGLFLRPADLQRLGGMGVEIANHTMSHSCGRLLAAAELETEITASKHLLEEMAGQPVRAFAFPWGNEQDVTPATMAAIRSSGHALTFLMHGRRNARRPAPDIWYRLLLLDQVGPSLRLACRVLPALRSARHAITGWQSAGAAKAACCAGSIAAAGEIIH
jgi:peptidoglycan/xylan/chitin deacetylase (PgdA/CDA1 family)